MDNQSPSYQPPTQPQAGAIPPLGLPPIGQLFQDSWSTFTQSLLSLFLLNILGIVIFLILGILGVFIVIITGAGSVLLKNGLQGIESNLPTLLGSWASWIVPLAIIAFIFGILSIVVGTALQAASVLLVESQGKLPVINAFKKGISFVGPLLLVGLITFFLTFGAFLVLFLPAILFGLLLMFTHLEIVLNNKRWIEAVKRSVLLVSSHFGGIFIRLFLFWLIYVGIAIVGGIAQSVLSTETKWIVSGISSIVNFLMGWFSLAYIINLYKHANLQLKQTPGKSITWMWVIAIFGWLIAIGISFAAWKFASSGILNQFEKPIPSPFIQQDTLNDYTIDEIQLPPTSI